MYALLIVDANDKELGKKWLKILEEEEKGWPCLKVLDA